MRPSDFLADFFSVTEGSIYLCSLPNERGAGKPAEVCGRGNGTRLDDLVNGWDRKDRGTFFCVNTLRPRQSRRSKETVHEIVCLHADIDFGKIDLGRDAVLAKLASLPCLPSKVVNSGHGLHCYWLLNEALPVTPENVAHVEFLLRALSAAVGGDPAVCEVARLMRLPGSYNTKNGERLPVEVIVDRPLRYELSDLEEWLEAQRPIIPRNGAAKPDNPFLAVDVPGVGGAPVDVEARLRAMRYEGVGDTAVHVTQLAVSAAMLNRGSSIDDTVDVIMKATQAAAGEAGTRWNWDHEARDIRAMCLRWQEKKAKANGSGSHQEQAQQPSKGFSFRSHRDRNMPSPRHLIKGLLPEIGTGLLAGQSGVYKSFVGLKLAGAIATGQPFISGYSTKRRGATLIFCSEGAGELPVRLEALSQAEHGGRVLPIYYCDHPVALLDPLSVQDCVMTASAVNDTAMRDHKLPLVSIQFDTVLGCSGFRASGDENDAVVGGKLMAALAEISQASSTFVLGIDHFGKSETTGTRGSSSKEARADVVLALLANKALSGEVTACRLAIRKSRSSHSGGQFAFTVRSVSLGLDEDNDPLSSLVVDFSEAPVAASSADQDSAWTRSLAVLRRIMMALLADKGEMIRPGPDEPEVRAIREATIREEFYRQHLADGAESKQEAKRKAYGRAVRVAQAKGLIDVREIDGRTFLWLTTAA